jgi:hypothetical protein
VAAPRARRRAGRHGLQGQSYRGKPVLTWWEGVHGGFGDGEYVIFDDSYKEIARFEAGKGLPGTTTSS